MPLAERTALLPSETCRFPLGVTASAFLMTSDHNGGSDLGLERDKNLCI